MPKLPFGWMPGHWGLRGKTPERAKAEYELSGKELNRRLVEIDTDEEDLPLALLTLDRKNGDITKEEYDYKYAEIKFEGTDEYHHVVLELDLRYHKINKYEYARKKADLNDEPWVGVLDHQYNPKMGTDGFMFELDWNQRFIQELRAAGYDGSTEEEIVEQWFEDKATEEFINFLGDEMENIPETDEYSVPSTHISREKLDDSKTKHS